MTLNPGTRLGPFEITALLGAGGMGEVYRATDTNLKREVAIKVLPGSVAGDSERLARFQREAEVLAALNHPNIAHIHGVEHAAGVPALVMELVDGPTLAERIAQGPIPLDEALPIAREIATALEAAHQNGVVHRDLKPANVKITPGGVVKVLDFGLAKRAEVDTSVPSLSFSPTVMISPTLAGTLIGTAAYMSPEQAKGRPADQRADLWAFGAVLFEMLTGRRTFRGDGVAETLAHVLMQQPDWDMLPLITPPSVRRVLRRCLEKEPQRRLDSAAAARLEIEDALAARSDEPAPRRAFWVTHVAALTVGVIALGALIAAAIAWTFGRPQRPEPMPVVRFSIVPPPGQALQLWPPRRIVALSPNGRALVYSSTSGLVVRAVDQLDGQLLPATQGAISPFFSPDSRWIGFFHAGDLKKVALDGGPAITISHGVSTPLDGSWGDDGTIVISSEATGLSRVAATGGEPEVLTPTKGLFREPTMLPGSGAVLFTFWAGQDESGARQTLSEDRQVSVLNLKTRQITRLVPGAFDAAYVATGHLLYRAAGNLFAVPFDLARLEVKGEPIRVGDALHGGHGYALSAAGTLAMLPSADVGRSLLWVDRSGHETPIGAPARPYSTLTLSPDGMRAAIIIDDEQPSVWIWDFMREALTRLTRGLRVAWVPVWMPNGRQIVFTANRTGVFNLYMRNADGSGAEERLTTSPQTQVPNSVTPDATFILAADLQADTGWDVVRIPLAATAPDARSPGTARDARAPRDVLVSTPSGEFAARISPDGRHFAYLSFESGQSEIYIRPYPDVGRERWQISSGGGLAPVWARNGRELFYLDAASGALMSVAIDTSGGQLKAGRPERLITTKYFGSFYSFDVSPDGQRFIFIKEPPITQSIVVVLNWQEELKQRVLRP